MTAGGQDRRGPSPEEYLGATTEMADAADLRAAVFGARLRELRTTKGMSPEEVAAAAGLGLGIYRQLESGASDLNSFTVDMLYDLTGALGSNPREFFKGLD